MKRFILFFSVVCACALLAGPAQQILIAISPNNGGATGTYYYTTPEASINSVDSNLSATLMLWYDITLGAGNATKIGIYISTINVPGSTVRLGLWNAGGTELIDVVTASITATGWNDITVTPVATTATAYKIGYIGQGNDDVDVGFNTLAGTNAGNYNASQSGGNFPASLPSSQGTFDGKSAMRVFVQ